MALNKELIDKIITVTSKAAISCNQFVGKNDKKNADKAATDAMRNEINKLDRCKRIASREGTVIKAYGIFKLSVIGFLIFFGIFSVLSSYM